LCAPVNAKFFVLTGAHKTNFKKGNDMNSLPSVVAIRAGELCSKNSNLRLGQATWQALNEICPGLANKVLNTKADPFLKENNIKGFYFWLRRQVQK